MSGWVNRTVHNQVIADYSDHFAIPEAQPLQKNKKPGITPAF
jgi:hypothetical protein